jgi:hypothetical protein
MYPYFIFLNLNPLPLLIIVDSLVLAWNRGKNVGEGWEMKPFKWFTTISS